MDEDRHLALRVRIVTQGFAIGFGEKFGLGVFAEPCCDELSWHFLFYGCDQCPLSVWAEFVINYRYFFLAHCY